MKGLWPKIRYSAFYIDPASGRVGFSSQKIEESVSDSNTTRQHKSTTMNQHPIKRRAFALSSIAITVIVLSGLSLPLIAQDSLPKTAETFEIDGNKAYLYAAPEPAKGKPWVWYAPTIGSLNPAERRAYFEAFAKAGISIAGFDLGEVRGSPASTAKFTLFYDAMVKRGFSPKPILLGQSRGGMMTLAWAFRNPDKVQAWVGIYPVCNLASWSLKSSKAQTLADFSMTEPELVAKLTEFNPIDNLQGLLKNKVPMFAVHGDVDKLVPYDLNTKILKERYEAGGGSIEVKVIPGKGHQVDPGFFACQELIDFVLKQIK